MYASVTQFELSSRDITLDVAQSEFERFVVPEMRKQSGYEGCYLLRGASGKGLMVSLWETEEALRAGEIAGSYAERFAEFKAALGVHVTTDSYAVGSGDHPLTG